MARTTRKVHRGGDANTTSKSKTKYNLGKNGDAETQAIVNKFLVDRKRRRTWMNWIHGHPRDAHDRDLRKAIDRLLRQYDEKTGDLKKIVKKIVEIGRRLERNKEEREMLEESLRKGKDGIRELKRQMDDIRREIDKVSSGLDKNPFKNAAPASTNPFKNARPASATKKTKANTKKMIVHSSKAKTPNSTTAASLAAAQKQEEEYQAEQARIEANAQAARNAAKAAANAANAAAAERNAARASRGINAAVGNLGNAVPNNPAVQEEQLLLENAKGNAFNQAGLPRAENAPAPEMGQGSAKGNAFNQAGLPRIENAPAPEMGQGPASNGNNANNKRQRKINTSLFD